jgi:glutathione S-transferase
MAQNVTLWGRSNSANVQKVLWALAELELDFEHRELGGSFGGLDSPKYLAMNPNGLVPCLQDGELAVWESHAILRYLAAAYGELTLWRQNPKERAVVDQWTDWAATTFQPAWLKLFWLVVRTPQDQQDRAVISAVTEQLQKALRILDGELASNDFIAGAALSYADCAAGNSLYRLFTMGLDLAPFPHVAAWYERLRQRSGFQRFIMVDYEELRGRLAF